MMDLQKAFNDLAHSEPWGDIGIFFDDYDPFEEFPLISRYTKISSLIHDLQITSITEFLVNTAFFTLNSAMLFAQNNNICIKRRFYAITFTDFDLSDPAEPPVPNFLIDSRESRANSLKKLRRLSSQQNSPEMNAIMNLFRACHLESAFTFYESRHFDEACNEELVRVFAVLR